MAVTRESTDPLWVQALRALEDDIRAGRLGPGRHLPAERVLGERLQVSRITLRRALQALAEQGLIEPSPGRGWQVSEARVGEPANALMSFSALGAARGLAATARVLRRDLRPATLDESETLRVAPGSEVLDLERLRFFDEVPIAVHSAILPTARVGALAEVDFTVASLFASLEERGVIPARSDSAAQAEAADERHAELLELAVGQPLMVVTEVVLDDRDQPIALGRVAYRGDRYRLETTFVRS
ncbi:MAG TPA: GntR family transcriptional regulator [Capillimicrobium sp.]